MRPKAPECGALQTLRALPDLLFLVALWFQGIQPFVNGVQPSQYFPVLRVVFMLDLDQRWKGNASLAGEGQERDGKEVPQAKFCFHGSRLSSKRFEPVITSDVGKEVLFTAQLLRQQFAHQRSFFLQFRERRVNLCSAELVDRQALDDFQLLSVAANRE